MAHFYLAYVTLHVLIHSCSFPLLILSLSKDSLICLEEVADSRRKVKMYLHTQ